MLNAFVLDCLFLKTNLDIMYKSQKTFLARTIILIYSKSIQCKELLMDFDTMSEKILLFRCSAMPPEIEAKVVGTQLQCKIKMTFVFPMHTKVP